MHEVICGKSSLISIDDTSVFVKKVPLTDLEQLPQHFMSTANIFDLPLSYQYGVGSAGLGVWRELATHIMTTNWVITECANFPLAHLPSSPGDININYCQSTPYPATQVSVKQSHRRQHDHHY
jgi:hypothetical protein